jgi:hypothetical protein
MPSRASAPARRFALAVDTRASLVSPTSFGVSLPPWSITLVQATPTSIFAAVAPNARTTTINNPVTAFATIINAGGEIANACVIVLPAGVPATFPCGEQPANLPILSKRRSPLLWMRLDYVRNPRAEMNAADWSEQFCSDSARSVRVRYFAG